MNGGLGINSVDTTNNSSLGEQGVNQVDNEFNLKVAGEDVHVEAKSDGSYDVYVRGKKYTLRGDSPAAIADLVLKIKKDIGDIKVDMWQIQQQILAIKAETSKISLQAAQKREAEAAKRAQGGK